MLSFVVISENQLNDTSSDLLVGGGEVPPVGSQRAVCPLSASLPKPCGAPLIPDTYVTCDAAQRTILTTPHDTGDRLRPQATLHC